MLLKHLMKMQRVFFIGTSKLFVEFFFSNKKIDFFSLRESLTALGKPAERLSDIEVMQTKSFNNTKFILFF